MMVCGDFIALCMSEDCTNWVVALIAGCTIFFSILIILLFFMWRIWREHNFDRTIFEAFRRTTCQVGGARNRNAQNSSTTPNNGNVQNSGVLNGQQ